MQRPNEKTRPALGQDERERFLAGRRNAVLATNRPNGPPQVTTVWYLWTGQDFYISTRRDRYKYRHLQRDPRVTLCIDDAMAFTSVVVEGHAEFMEADIWDTTRMIVERYVDKPFAERMLVRMRSEPRVLLVVHPEKWLSWDISRAVLPLV
jgi:PPOX class probable F420-dependent enzyme